MGALASRKAENLTLLLALLAADDLPLPTLHYRFAAPRRWAFDLAYVALKVAIEVEGGIWVQGRHTRGLGFENDLRKYNAAVLDGWLLLRVSYGMIGNGEVLTAIRQPFARRSHCASAAMVVAIAAMGAQRSESEKLTVHGESSSGNT